MTKCVTKTADVSIKESADAKQDLKLLCDIREADLIAREAHYHNSCSCAYTQKDDRHNDVDEENDTSQQTQAHEKAFQYITGYVENSIIKDGNVERVTMLREKNCIFMQIIKQTS